MPSRGRSRLGAFQLGKGAMTKSNRCTSRCPRGEAQAVGDERDLHAAPGTGAVLLLPSGTSCSCQPSRFPGESS